MSKQINTDKKTVRVYLSSGKKSRFVIPDYQRPYAWENEHIETLFTDLKEFANENLKVDNAEYFLGPVVSFENENGEQEIIDGQQRITSLFLLLRAFYDHLSNAECGTPEVEHALRDIRQTLWVTNPITGDVDSYNPLLSSKVLDEKEAEVFNKILGNKEVEVNEKANDRYSKNYSLFKSYIEELSKTDPTFIYHLIQAILDKVILLPITADTQDTALTIFTTLNNRGLQLSDADIFKAKLYSHSEDKENFINEWKKLDDDAISAGETIQRLFYNYMFYIRALNKDNKATTPGLRKFYSNNNFSNLYDPELFNNLKQSLTLWRVINKHEEFDEEPWTRNKGILKALDILRSYPNDFWKYPVEVYYLTYHNKDTFAEEFERFLHKFIRVLLSIYLISPSVTTIKGDISKLDIAILDSSHPTFAFSKTIDDKEIKDKLQTPHVNTLRMILKILAYQEKKQDELLPDSWEVEHIFPQKWQKNYFTKFPDSEIQEHIEHLGNKLPFEKKLNISAGNGYFAKKKQEYSKSNIIITKNMGKEKCDEWNIYSIRERDLRTVNMIMDVFTSWDDKYEVKSPKKRKISRKTN